MLIGLLSDTHLAFPSQPLPPQVLEAFKGVDLILHMGDVWIPSVLDTLESVAPVLAARGDDDMDEDFGEDSRMKKMQVLSLEGVTIWATHIKPRYGLIVPQEQNTIYSSIFSRQSVDDAPSDPPDVVVFGHTHFAEIEEYKGVLLVNPGSPTMPSYIPKLGSVGFLTIKDGKAEARLVNLE
ncbi:MAG TPA: metallophosphoesterase family protein [Dehalococcoidia bacterium]|nr:metallophosphoesterase family protein [Dehalococcoidia bacterium]